MRTFLALTVFGGGIVQATLAPALRIGDVAPDIPLIVVVLLALRRGSETGCLAGFAAGLLQDIATGGLIGVQALTKAVVGFGVGALGGRLRVTQPLVQVPGLLVLSVAEGLGRFFLLKLFRFPAPFTEVMTYVVLPQAVYNGFLGAAFVFALLTAESFRDRSS
ncbi:MAG: rod shape-determining protein MreD [Candidatus Rokuibacteriota bacterium]|nr:MAG: rod shape-determining protein MreD [Candidatus Rokubacteria bacterium]